jgi:methyl-accepting chemotaxis protein
MLAHFEIVAAFTDSRTDICVDGGCASGCDLFFFAFSCSAVIAPCGSSICLRPCGRDVRQVHQHFLGAVHVEYLAAGTLHKTTARLAGSIAGRLYTTADAAEAATRASVKTWMLIAFGLAVVIVCGLSLLIGRSISKAIASMVSAMIRLAGGDLRIAIPGRGRKDEIGEMADAVEVFKSNMIEADRLRAEQLEVEQRQAERRMADMRELANAFEGAVGEIVETVSSAATELEASAHTLRTTAEQSQQLAAAVAAASEEASTNVQSVASASEEMTSSVNEISRQVQESSRVANEAVSQAQRTNDRVGEL